MTLAETMTALEQAGTEQNRRIYARHGVTGPQFGVSFAVLSDLKKKIETDHALAEGLWASGNHDARILATMIADPAAASAGLLESWAKDADNRGIADAVGGFAAKTRFAQEKARSWSRARGEWIARAGWRVHALLALGETPLPDSDLESLLATIEREIHGSKNWVRDAMNGALIAIGSRNPALTERALAAAKRIGQVEVDHGETGCKTPDAADYIAKMVAHRARKGARVTPAAKAAKGAPRAKAAKSRPAGEAAPRAKATPAGNAAKSGAKPSAKRRAKARG
jgi:3-methyladenine DNA glycosylase AlkD